MSHDVWREGQLIGGRYRLERPLAQGGMGSVWIAEHLALSSSVAVKLIDRAGAESEELRGRFLREAQAAASLRSPHVVQILDHGLHDDAVPFIVMELLDGETLATCLKKSGGSLTPARIARIMTHVARAVGKAHEKGIVHRDLKPDNIFLVQNDDEELVKVLDFGIAKVRGAITGALSSSNTRTGTLLGTPYYMSPEQARGNSAIDFRTDLWSMAVITFEAICGKLPFESDGLGDLVIQICTGDMPVPSDVCDVPPGFDAWFARAAERNPAKRFASAREQADALRAVLAPELSTRASLADVDTTMEGPTKLLVRVGDEAPAPRMHIADAPTMDAKDAGSGAPARPSLEDARRLRAAGVPASAVPTVVTAASSTTAPETLASPGSPPAPASAAPDSDQADTQPDPLRATTHGGAVSEPRQPRPQREGSRVWMLGAVGVAAVAGVAAFLLMGSRTGPPPAATPEPSASPRTTASAATPAPSASAPPPATTSAVPASSPAPAPSAAPPTTAPPARAADAPVPKGQPARKPAARPKDELGI